MKKTFLVILHEIKATLNRKAYVVLGIGLPIILGVVAIIVSIANRDSQPGSLTPSLSADGTASQIVEGYVDPGSLIKSFPPDFPTGRLREFPTEEAAQIALDENKIEGYYLIPSDYSTSHELTYVSSDFNPIEENVSTHNMQFILLMNIMGSFERAERAWNPMNLRVTEITSSGATDYGGSWIVELVPNLMAFILYIVILMPAGGLVNAVTDEKKNQVMEILMSSISSTQLITGKIIALGLLGLLQTTLWFGVLWGVVKFGGSPLAIPPGFELPSLILVWAGVFGLLGYAMYGAMMAGLGALAPDIKATQGPSFLIMSPLIIVYVFLIGIVGAPNSAFSVGMSLFPLTAPVAMIARMAKTTVPFWQIGLSVTLQLLTAMFIVWTIAKLFRAQAILSGQKFSVKRYFAAFIGKA